MEIITQILKLKHQMNQEFAAYFVSNNTQLNVQKKQDQSLVTDVDILVSGIVKRWMKEAMEPNFNFVCEEDNHNLIYPCIILDPIDGTKELVKERDECCISLGIYNDQKIANADGWLYNPFTGFEANTWQPYIKRNHHLDPLLGLVSRTEWENGLVSDLSDQNILLHPKGSIALKLAMLGAGLCDFVFSRHSKSIWDVAAGSAFCSKRGIKLYNPEGEITSFKDIRVKGPFCWCRDSIKKQLSERFKEINFGV